MCFFHHLYCQMSTFNFHPCSGRLLQDLGPGCRSSKDGKNAICKLNYWTEAYWLWIMLYWIYESNGQQRNLQLCLPSSKCCYKGKRMVKGKDRSFSRQFRYLFFLKSYIFINNVFGSNSWWLQSEEWRSGGFKKASRYISSLWWIHSRTNFPTIWLFQLSRSHFCF